MNSTYVNFNNATLKKNKHLEYKNTFADICPKSNFEKRIQK